MAKPRRVIGAEHVQAERAKGRVSMEILPGDIVTAQAEESAVRLGLKLVPGPLERPPAYRTDGSTALRRALFRRSPRWAAPQRRMPKPCSRFDKIAFVGCGAVGANTAHLVANCSAADEIALVDITPGLAEAVALDLNHASGISRSNAKAIGSAAMEAIEGADVIVVTAGRARSHGMSRTDLMEINRRVIRVSAEAIRVRAPCSVVIVVTNPLDEMTLEMIRATEFPRERVLGMAGTLDSSRFRSSLANAAGVGTPDVEALVLGSHGDEMTPIVSRARIRGRPVETFLDKEAIASCVHDAVTGGGQVVALRKIGSASLAPAHACMELIDHIRGARTGIVPVSVKLEGEFGISDVVLGVPCHLGRSGLVQVEEIALLPSEQEALASAAEAIRARLEE